MNAYFQFSPDAVVAACDNMIAALQPALAKAKRDYAWLKVKYTHDLRDRRTGEALFSMQTARVHLEHLQTVRKLVRDASQIKAAALTTPAPVLLDAETAARLGLIGQSATSIRPDHSFPHSEPR